MKTFAYELGARLTKEAAGGKLGIAERLFSKVVLPGTKKVLPPVLFHSPLLAKAAPIAGKAVKPTLIGTGLGGIGYGLYSLYNWINDALGTSTMAAEHTQRGR